VFNNKRSPFLPTIQYGHIEPVIYNRPYGSVLGGNIIMKQAWRSEVMLYHKRYRYRRHWPKYMYHFRICWLGKLNGDYQL
jgi:hypothetical protein